MNTAQSSGGNVALCREAGKRCCKCCGALNFKSEFLGKHVGANDVDGNAQRGVEELFVMGVQDAVVAILNSAISMSGGLV